LSPNVHKTLTAPDVGAAALSTGQTAFALENDVSQLTTFAMRGISDQRFWGWALVPIQKRPPCRAAILLSGAGRPNHSC
jgi:hypothetical protein